MGYRHSRDDILEGALEVALRDSLSELTFGRVAKHLGVSDRMVVYYFPTKDDLVTEVIILVGARLMEVLGRAFDEPAPDHLALARQAWPILARPAVDPVFALFFEANGMAAAGRSPYDLLVPQLVASWVDWTAGYLTGTRQRRREEAEAVIALLDGLLLLRQLAGPAAANRAAKRLGVR
ncbi:MAG: TetR/AcrR family transcriptional regulator [Acidimicrobiia bacterium]